MASPAGPADDPARAMFDADTASKALGMRLLDLGVFGGPFRARGHQDDARYTDQLEQPPGCTLADRLASLALEAARQPESIRRTRPGAGTATVEMEIGPAMVNGHGIAHGGYLFLLADTAFACACNGRGPVTVAAAADITFVAPAAEGDTLEARAEERVSYGRSGVYDVTVRRGDTVIAEFRGRSRSLGPGRPH